MFESNFPVDKESFSYAVAELDDQSRYHGGGELHLDKLNALTLGTLHAARLR